MAAPMKVQTLALLDELVLTCRGLDCVEQWCPGSVTDGAPASVQLSTERCPACGSSCWEVTQVQVAGSPVRARRRAARAAAKGGRR